MISVSQVDKTFGTKWALRKINLEVRPGEVAALLGPNGAGKSTLLRLLATLTRPTRGKITLGEFELPEYAAEARGLVGYLGHQTLLYDDLTVQENLLFYARLYALPAREARIGAVAKELGIERRLNETTRTLSRGWQQRAALARSLLHEPQIWLLDEPYTGLDTASAERLQELIRAARGRGAAVLFSSHDFERALAVCDRVVILAGGRLAYDEPRAVWKEPATLLERYAQATRARP